MKNNDNYNELSKLFDNTPRICEECSGPYEYQGAGEYKCKNCGHIAYDDYGKVRKFIDEHGPAPYHVVKKATGVNGSLVREYLDSPNTEKTFDRKCQKCGCRIASGRLCSTCQMLEGRDEVFESKDIKNYNTDKYPKSKREASKGSGVHFVVDRNER